MSEREYTKFIPCPEHPTGRTHWWDPRRHQAILFCHPGKYAGIWECPVTGSSDSCEHENWEIEDAVYDYYDPGDAYGHGQREFQVYVCADCGVQIEDADPAEDRAEALADMQIMEALGK